MRLIWLALVAALFAGCGGGGAGGGSVQPGSTPGAVRVDISTQAASGATVLYAVEFTLLLPAGVTLPADASSGELTAGVLHAADSASLAGGRFLPATTDSRASVKVNIVDPVGFAVGNLATLNCTVSPGASVNTAQFSLEGFSARDANGAVIPGITTRFTLQTQ